MGYNRVRWHSPPAAMFAHLLSIVRLVLAAVGAFVLIVTFTPLVPWAALRLSCNWTDSDGDVLIVLGGDTIIASGFPSGKFIGEHTYRRALAAVYAWRAGHFRYLLLSGADIGQTVKPLLVASGIPEAAILSENQSTSTRENALYAKPILAGLSGRFVLLTSDYHMFRAARSFAHEHIPVVTRPCPDLSKTSRPLAYRVPAFWTLSGELVKIVYYWSRGWI